MVESKRGGRLTRRIVRRERERDANAWPRREEAAVVYKEARVRGQCDLLSIISTWRQMSVMQESNIMQGM